MVFMGIRVLLIKGSVMSNTSVGGNKAMKKKRVYCIKTEDKLERYKLRKELMAQKNCDSNLECGSCSCG